MNYTILIYETAADFAVRNGADAKKREDYWAAWPPYSKALKEAGIFVGGCGSAADRSCRKNTEV